jgi:hypothetical protein
VNTGGHALRILDHRERHFQILLQDRVVVKGHPDCRHGRLVPARRGDWNLGGWCVGVLSRACVLSRIGNSSGHSTASSVN